MWQHVARPWRIRGVCTRCYHSCTGGGIRCDGRLLVETEPILARTPYTAQDHGPETERFSVELLETERRIMLNGDIVPGRSEVRRSGAEVIDFAAAEPDTETSVILASRSDEKIVHQTQLDFESRMLVIPNQTPHLIYRLLVAMISVTAEFAAGPPPQAVTIAAGRGVVNCHKTW